jgi:cytochrome P450
MTPVGRRRPPSGLPRPRSDLHALLRLGGDPLERPEQYFDELGDTFELRLFGATHVLTRDPVWFDEVLVKKSKSFQKDRATKGLGALLGQGLLVRDGAPWRERRRVLSASFTPVEIEGHLAAFRAETLRELDRWRAGETVDLHRAMARLTMRIALVTLFGYEPGASDRFEDEMAAAMRYFEGVGGTQVPLPTWVPTRVNRGFVLARRRFRAFLERVIAQTAPPSSVLGVLEEARRGGRLSHDDVVDEAMTMLVAGHETSALSLTYLLAELGLQPELQGPIASEAASWDDPPTLRDITTDGAVHRAVLEGLRLYPVTWVLGREALEAVDIAGCTVNAGTQIYLFQWSMQRSPRFFERARELWPDRFIEQPLPSLPKGRFTPFGMGPRICIGNQFALAEIAVILTDVLRRFRIETKPPFPPRLRASITARPRDPVLVSVLPR